MATFEMAFAQAKIQFRSADRAECVKSDMAGLQAHFSFSSLDAINVETTRGEFSEIHIEGAYPNGNVGEPQLPMFTRLIAIPTGATPVVKVSAHSETEYTLSDYGIGTVSAMQAPIRKNVDPSTVEYVYSEAAYARDSYNNDPIAMVEVLGTMRGITLGRLIVQPVRYNPVAGTVKVFNDIEVNVDFENGDAEGTMQMFTSTANIAFQSVYDQIFNIDMLMGGSRDAYPDHPDFYNTPVKVLVICYSGFQGNAALNSWLQWKLQKGYYVDIYYTNETGTTANSIKDFIKTKYNASVSAGNAYTYLIVIGDTGQVPQYMTKTIDNTIGECASDLGYSSVNFTTSSTTNYFPDMYYSRISVENTTQLTNYINKVLTYEKFEFTDGGNYLNNVILVGGWDSNWTSRVAKPTINYATNYYFNSSNTTYGGFGSGTINATISTSSTQGWSGTNHGCYDGLNNGVCFLNYTAHGDKQEWQGPQFTAKQAEGVTNTGKYFFAVGNCCLTGNYNLNDANYSSSYAPSSSIGATACFGETMIRVPNAGAIAYVGCAPYSYWYEDFYWAVGAHSYSQGNYPTQSASSNGVYDIMFTDQYWNSASALLYVGNLSVQQAVTNGNQTSSVTDGDCNNSAHYYFQFYHTLGDGSIMPYITKPEANTVTIPSTVTPSTSSITVNAVAGSYVAVTDNSSVIYGVAEANSSGVATVNFTNAIPGTGTLHVVVTRQQYQPYFGTINIVGGTQYNITVTQPQHGTINAPSQAYAGTTVTLTATPETGYCLSSWTVKQGSTNITVTNNQFTMPEGNVTVTATFVQGLAVTLAPVTHGSISADPMYALQGTTINLTATPASGYEFGSWVVYKTGDASTTVAVSGDSFTMPNYPVTISATFVLAPTELTVYEGTATNQYIPMYGYYFDDFTKSECIIPASTLTAMNGCSITAITFYPSSVSTRNWDGSEQTVFLKEVSGTTLGGSYSGTSGATTVKQGLLEMPTAGEAYTITFDTPYEYNGGNLLIGVYNTTDGSYNQVYWYGTSGLTSGVSAYGSDGSSLGSVGYTAQTFLPKTTFTYLQASNDPVAITVSANPANGGTVTGAGIYDPGTTATLTATANEGYTFTNWTRNGVVMSTNSTYSFNVSFAAEYVANFTINSYNITVTANPTDGGTVTVGTSKDRNDLVYDFEDGWQNWTTFQGNTTSPHSWMHNTEYVAYDSNGSQIVPECHNSSSGMMLSESYISASTSGGSDAQAVTPDNYLVSPQFRLGGSFTFYAASRMSNYPAEKFSVLVSESGNNSPSYFTHTELTVTLSDNSWNEYTVDLSNYSGMGYVAIRHFDCNDQHLLYIDDVTIVEGQNPSTANGNFNHGETCVATATPVDGYYFANWTEYGTVVSTSASYAFTVTGGRDLVANFGTSFNKEILGYGGSDDNWYLIASPLAGVTDPAEVNNLLSNAYDLYQFDPTQDQEWRNFKGHNFNLQSGQGYLYANSSNVTLTFTGVPYSGDGQVTLSLSNGDEFGSWNFVGNPFHQTAYIAKDCYIMNDERTELESASAGTPIDAMEGLFVIADNNGELLTFSTQAPAKSTKQLVINVSKNRGCSIDRAVVRFNSNSMLPKFLLNENSTKLYIPQNGKDYAIVNSEDHGELPLNFKTDRNGNYTLSIQTENATMGYLHLIDNLTGNDVDLLVSPSYTFEAKTTDYASRFKLVFATGEASDEHFAFFSNGNLIINNAGVATLQVIDINGRILSSESINGCHSKSLGVASGVYMLRLINDGSVKTQKVIVE